MAEDPNTGFKEKLKQTILTDAGRHIFLSVGNGVGTLVYTRAILSSQKPVNSSGQALDDEAIRQITSLPDDLKEGQLTLTPVTDDHFDVIADFNNKNQPADINFSCIGWYARVDSTNEQNQKVQGDEALIAITFTTNDHETLAAGSPDGLSTDVISAQLSMTIAEAANIDMTVNEVGYVTRAELNAWQTKVTCLLYTSDAADDTPCVDLGGRRIIKKKKKFFFFFFFFFFFLFFFYFFFFSSRRRHTRSSTVSWARRCV